MYLEIWHIAVLILFVVACVIINYMSGIRKGIEISLFGLSQRDIIGLELKEDRIIVSSNGKYTKKIDAIDIIQQSENG